MTFSTLVLLAASAAASVAPVAAVEDHGYGPVDPAPVPNVEVVTHTGRRVRLPELLRGRRAAVQFIFVDCQTACPLLGSLFHNVESRLDEAENLALISISVNPERDTPERLAGFLQRHQASPRWTAVRAERADLTEILKVFGQKDGPPSGHTMQVFFTDRLANYVGRTVMLPQAARVANALLGKIEMAGRASSDAGAAPALPQANRKPGATGGEIYFGAAPVPARLGGELIAAEASRCANCHGAERQGVAEGRTRPSPLHAVSLTQPQPRRGGPASHYTAESLCTSLRTGIDPAGVMYAVAMPRYELTNGECRALADFLLTK
ncbi:MAG: SCO family protein [Bryobacterales bacterium]|nr:SCO family protein [Bryobacterales bacterium]